MRKIAAIAAVALLSGCMGKTGGTVVRAEIREIRVPVRTVCPDRSTYDALKSSRPVPLRTQPMPASAEERVAKGQAQLGRYEAEGGWADQVTAALDRCQREGVVNTDPVE